MPIFPFLFLSVLTFLLVAPTGTNMPFCSVDLSSLPPFFSFFLQLQSWARKGSLLPNMNYDLEMLFWQGGCLPLLFPIIHDLFGKIFLFFKVLSSLLDSFTSFGGFLTEDTRTSSGKRPLSCSQPRPRHLPPLSWSPLTPWPAGAPSIFRFLTLLGLSTGVRRMQHHSACRPSAQRLGRADSSGQEGEMVGLYTTDFHTLWSMWI